MADKLAIVAAFPEKLVRVRFLKIASADFGRRYLRGNGQHRDPRAMAVEQAVDKVEIARAAASGAHGQFAAEMGFGPCREGGCLFMAGMDPLYVASLSQRFREPVQAVADHPIYPLDPRRIQHLCQDISYLGIHRMAPGFGFQVDGKRKLGFALRFSTRRIIRVAETPNWTLV